MIKFYTGASFVNHGDGVYFITPASGVPYIQTVVGGVQKKVAELNNGYSTAEMDAIKKELSDAISKNAGDITTVANALSAITTKWGATLENLEAKVTKNTEDIGKNADAIEDIVDGTTTVAKAANATNAANADKATKDASGNVITSTYATKEELQGHKDYVGTFTAYKNEQGKDIDTVIEYIDDKTTGIASDSAVQALGNRVSTVEGYFDNDGNAKNALDANHADEADMATEAKKTTGTLTVGEKSFNGSANVSVTAADLGLDNALHFLGTTSTAITDGGSEQPTIGGSKVTPQAGDIVLWENQEYIWNTTNKWEVFGNEGSYAIKTQQITAGAGLTGGGDLSADREIAHAVPDGAGVSKNVTAQAGKYVSSLTFDEFGHVVGVATADEKTYEGEKGISVGSNGKIGHTNNITAGTAQGSATGNVGFGGTINIPTITYDAQGHVTGTSTTTVTLPSDERIVAVENSLVWYDAANGQKL